MNHNKVFLFDGMLMRKIAWKALRPVREYVRRSPIKRGRGLLLRRVLMPILPGNHATFSVMLGEGPKVELEYRETLGKSLLMNNGFEEAERRALRNLVSAGSTAFDIGANVGLFTVSLASSVGDTGTIVAFEPVKETADRLRQNLSINRLANTNVIVAAAGNRSGKTEVVHSIDSAYNATTSTSDAGSHPGVTVDVLRVDSVWEQLGKPTVAVMKIDVEGAELTVLQGAAQLLQTCRPALLVEAPTEAQLLSISEYLTPYGYKYSQPHGFMSWNYLYKAADHQERRSSAEASDSI